MTCKAVLAKASAYIDGELSGFEMLDIRSHLHSCGACQQELDQMRYLKKALCNMPETDPGDEFAARLKERVFSPDLRIQLRRTPVAMVSGFAFVTALAVSLVALHSQAARRHIKTAAQVTDTAASFDISRDQAYQAGGDAFNDASFIITASAPANGSR